MGSSEHPFEVSVPLVGGNHLVLHALCEKESEQFVEGVFSATLLVQAITSYLVAHWQGYRYSWFDKAFCCHFGTDKMHSYGPAIFQSFRGWFASFL